MIIVTREFVFRPADGGAYKDTELKVFADDDIEGLQNYLNKNNGTFSFQKL